MPFEIILEGIDEYKSAMIDWNNYRIGYFLARNKHKSTANEDALTIKEHKKSLLFGVSDGAGGHPRGKDASLICVQEISDSSEQTNMLERFESANDKILALKAGAHATLTAGHIENDVLRSYSVGDSELIYWNSVGTELYSTIPQSEIGYKIEAGMIEQEDSLDEPDRYLVNNLMGDPSIRIEATSKMLLKKGHTVLAGSDGLFDNLSHEKLTEMVGKGSFEAGFDSLCQFCIDQEEKSWKKDDDISFILLRKVR